MKFTSEPEYLVSGCTKKKEDCYLNKVCANTGCKLTVDDSNGERSVHDDNINRKDNVISDVCAKRIEGICHLCPGCGDIEIKVPDTLLLFYDDYCNKVYGKGLCLLEFLFGALRCQFDYNDDEVALLIDNNYVDGDPKTKNHWITLKDRHDFEQKCQAVCECCKKVHVQIAKQLENQK